ncbi:unnamed protein product [Adineta steineri]|uniref:DYW domain-containing protein n=1 Tax=Adineta steineri TaxID=433720 RepID=A0A819MTC1_9BILA|nr:unnamed protein product [Adineta steineri]CAF3983836.1 unnamed protein product [Adineta steineri]
MFDKIFHTYIRRFILVKKTNICQYSISSSLMNINRSMKNLLDEEKYQEALNIFKANYRSIVSDIAINFALKSCTKLKNLEHGKNIHQNFSSQIMSNSFLNTSLIHFYMTCNDEDNAYRVFSSIKNKTSGAYGAMFKGFITNKKVEKVFELYNKMSIEADDITLIILFNACAQLPNEHGINIKNKFLNQMPKLFTYNTNVLNSFLHMLMKFNEVSTAEKIFVQMKSKDIFTYGIMMQGFFDNKMFEKTLNIFEEMPFHPNRVILIILFKTCSQLVNDRALKLATKIYNQMSKKYFQDSTLLTSILHMFMKYSHINNAEKVFKQIQMKNLIHYGAMINGYNINNQPEKCLKLFKELKEKNLEITEPILIMVLHACSQIGLLDICQTIFNQIPSHLLNNHRLQNTLIDMWGKVGFVNKSLKIFESIEKRDVMTYTSMINAFGLNGMGYEAIGLYKRMPIHIQDEITHICVLNACSHSGLVDQAYSIFNNIQVKTEKIITTMVDCFSRMFMFDEAQQLIHNFELSHPPCLVMYMALLSGARNHRNLTLSKKIYQRMKQLFPDNKQALISASILLSHIYSSVGEDQEAKQVRLNRLEEIGKNRIIGTTWTAYNGEIVRFKAHDRSHPQSREIYDEIGRISTELMGSGHEYDSRWITREINDDESIESILCGHSEKLALAFNFIQQPIPDIIQLTNNLRICGDCHSAIKSIAKLRQRSILIRDANRIHHFDKNGQCSCQDHF